jgi:hypothetical protein
MPGDCRRGQKRCQNGVTCYAASRRTNFADHAVSVAPGKARDPFQEQSVMAMKSKTKGKGKGDDEDEDSPFMPLEEVLRRLKAGPMNFGMYQTSDKDSPVLIAAHKRKNPEFLGKQAKKEAGSSKGAFGRLVLESGELRFECENDKVPRSLQRKLRILLKTNGFMKFKPRVLLPGGVELGDEGEDDDDDDVIAPGGSATKTHRGASGKKDDGGDADKRTQDLKEQVQDEAANLVPQLQDLAGGNDEQVATQADKLLKLLQATFDKEDWKKARGVLRVAEKLVRAGSAEEVEDLDED